MQTMHSFRLLPADEQIAAFLRAELERGLWVGRMPGVNWLAAELGVNRRNVEAALRQLEKEGWLAGHGRGHKRRIAARHAKGARPMRIGFMDYEQIQRTTEGYTIEVQHLLREAGHTVFFTEKCLTDLDMDVEKVARVVRRAKADAWVVSSASREVLEWFSAQPVPAFAFFGRREGLPIAGAGPDKVPALLAATRHLIGLGHRSILQLVRRERRYPLPGRGEQAILDELKAHGIPTGRFNLPDWEETVDGFHACLHELFRVTPPTALIIDEAQFFVAAYEFLAHTRIRVPEQVSLVCTNLDHAFEWWKPPVSHIRWDYGPVVRRIVRWAANVSRGREDLRQTLTPAEFVEGGTVGPAPRRRARA